VAVGQPVLGAEQERELLPRRGRVLEGLTLGWNVAGIAVLTVAAIAAIAARSVALAGVGLDSLIEIGASVVVLWKPSGTGEDRQRRALPSLPVHCSPDRVRFADCLVTGAASYRIHARRTSRGDNGDW
jgi:hypothetical protein